MPDSYAQRVQFILDGQQHCDHFLTPLADPAGKSVLVLGSGSGTEMLYCLRLGAREVVGIDISEQTPAALIGAAESLGLDVRGRFSMHRLPIEKAPTLERQFELILSNNVLEHVSDITNALRVCARMVKPGGGRVAIFTDPLYYSSLGSHLPVQPWEHLWGEPEKTRAACLAALPGNHAHHALQLMTLKEYLFEEITLNRMTIRDLVDAVVKSGLQILNMRLVRDRHTSLIPQYRERIKDVSATDLSIEGVGLELFSIAEGTEAGSIVSREEALNAQRIGELEWEVETREAAIESHLAAIKRLEIELTERDKLIRSVEGSISFRLGRALTRPLRAIRGRRG